MLDHSDRLLVKRFTSVAAVLATIVVVYAFLLGHRKGGAQSLTSLATSDDKIASQKLSPDPSENHEHNLSILGEIDAHISNEAKRVLDQALLSAGLIELQMRKFDRGSSGYRLLQGLQKKLFIDDFRYASHMSKEIDCSKAEQIFESLSKRLDRLETIEIRKQFFGEK